MIYAEGECGSTNPWFDVVTGRCRGDTTNPVQIQLDDHESELDDHESELDDHEERITALE